MGCSTKYEKEWSKWLTFFLLPQEKAFVFFLMPSAISFEKLNQTLPKIIILLEATAQTVVPLLEDVLLRLMYIHL